MSSCVKVFVSQVQCAVAACQTWTGFCAGAEGYSTEEDQELLSRIEKQLKRRFVIGSQVSEHAIVQDFTRQVKLHLHEHSKFVCMYVCTYPSGRGPAYSGPIQWGLLIAGPLR